MCAGQLRPGEDHGAAGMGPSILLLDRGDGRLLGDQVPWRHGRRHLLQVQFPLHSGRIAGLPGLIFISAMALAVAILSVTGVVIWLRKRSARLRPRTVAELSRAH